MPPALLKCMICSKKPNFSDVSHLLTHVGSKSHLAALHSLQVRSHREPDAHNELTLYNQWYQHHGVAIMLSERLEQKNSKKMTLRQVTQDVEDPFSTDLDEKTGPIGTLLTHSAAPKHRPFKIEPESPVLKHIRCTEDGLESGSLDSSEYPILSSSPSPYNASTHAEDRPDEVDGTAPNLKHASGSPQLKGKQWPGMNIFDSAPEDIRRRRNQKKDESVLINLRYNSTLITPIETVHSPTIDQVLKSRHMDNMEDDSAVEGEIIVPKPIAKKRRAASVRSSTQPKKTKQRTGGQVPPKVNNRHRHKPRGSSNRNAERKVDMTLQTPKQQPDSASGLLQTPPKRSTSIKPKAEHTAFDVYQDASTQMKQHDNALCVDVGSSVDGYEEEKKELATTSVNVVSWNDNSLYSPFRLFKRYTSDHADLYTDVTGQENFVSHDEYVQPHSYSILNPLFLQNQLESSLRSMANEERRMNSLSVVDSNAYDQGETHHHDATSISAFEMSRSPIKVESSFYDDDLNSQPGFTCL